MTIEAFFELCAYNLNNILDFHLMGYSLKYIFISAFIASCGVSLIRKRSNH